MSRRPSWPPWLKVLVISSGGKADCWFGGALVSEVALPRKSDPVRSVRNRLDKSAEVFFRAQRDGNSAHMWTLDKLVDVGRV